MKTIRRKSAVLAAIMSLCLFAVGCGSEGTAETGAAEQIGAETTEVAAEETDVAEKESAQEEDAAPAEETTAEVVYLLSESVLDDPGSNDYSGRETNKYEYDDQGKLVKCTTYSEDTYGDETHTSKIVYEYDDHENQISETHYDSEDTVTTARTVEYEYDDDGTVCKTTEYNEDGLLSSYIIFDEKGSVIESYIDMSEYDMGVFKETYEVEYDDYGNAIKSVEYDENGECVGIIEYEYDENNNEIKMLGDGVIEWGHEYDENNNKIRDIYYEDGEESEWTEYEYDEHNNLIRAVYYETDGSMRYTITYTYITMEVTK